MCPPTTLEFIFSSIKYFIPFKIPSATFIGVFLLIARKTSIPDISGTFIAKMSFVTLHAAISPAISGSSIIGVKISIFLTSIKSLLGIGIIAASSISPVNPTLANNLFRSFCPSLQLHPCIFTSEVNRYFKFLLIHLNFLRFLLNFDLKLVNKSNSNYL